MRTAEQLSEHTRRLPQLKVGNQVRIQNQVDPHPKKWDKTGTVIEVRQFDQYVIRVDGSGRVTIRNRKFLCKFTPVHPQSPRHTITEDLHYLPTTPYQPPVMPTNTPPPGTPALTPPPPPTHPSPPMPSTPVHHPISEQLQTPDSVLPDSPNKAKRPPLALRRLQDYNNTGLKE